MNDDTTAAATAEPAELPDVVDARRSTSGHAARASSGLGGAGARFLSLGGLATSL